MSLSHPDASLTSRCLRAAAKGAIKGGDNDLFRELVHVDPTIIQHNEDLVVTAIRSDNPGAYFMLDRDDEPLTESLELYGITNNQWGEHSSTHGPERDLDRLCYITSIHTIDEMLARGCTKAIIWLSLAWFLGSAEGMALLKHFEERCEVTNHTVGDRASIKVHHIIFDRETPTPIKDQIFSYIYSTSLSGHNKTVIAMSMRVVDMSNIDVTLENHDPEMILRACAWMMDRDPRHRRRYADLIVYTGGKIHNRDFITLRYIEEHCWSIEVTLALISLSSYTITDLYNYIVARRRSTGLSHRLTDTY